MVNRKKIRKDRVCFYLIMVLMVGIIVEAGARLIFEFQDKIRTSFNISVALDLDEYEMPHPDLPDHRLLKPGFSMTLGEAIKYKKKSGRILAVKYLKTRSKELNIKNDDVVFQINNNGYKGPDIDKEHSGLRVLSIGDSCTFGTYFDRYSYPRAMERELNRILGKTEVINGGVEGYSPKNILHRIYEFKSLRPEITTIYIGWNALYAERYLFGTERYLFSLRLFKAVADMLSHSVSDPKERALLSYKKKKHPDPDAPEVKRLNDYTPSFMDDIERIIDEMRKAGSRVALLTLPGLYVTDEPVTDLALIKGHLPVFTDNPYVLARMCERLNIALREMAERKSLQIIDLDKWARTALRPSDRYFFDSVHMYEEGQEMIGIYIANELLKVFTEKDH